MEFNNLIEHFKNYVNFSQEELESFTALLSRKEYKKGDFILKIGSTESNLRFIERGICRQYIEKNEENYTSDICLEHSFCTSYGSFTHQKPSRIGIIALTDVVVFEMKYDDLNHLYSQSKEGERMGRLAAEESFAAAEDKLIDLITRTALERYQDLLDQDPHLLLKIPQKYIAEYLRMSPESLSRLKREVV